MGGKTRRYLVVDACVAMACGGDDTHARGKRCRDFLTAMRKICHRVILGTDAFHEWRRHACHWAIDWVADMESHGKVRCAEFAPNYKLRSEIDRVAETEKQRQTMEKDIHLVEVALDADAPVVSLDDTARRLFARASVTVRELRGVVWVNPDNEAEGPCAWLRRGAKTERNRRLDSLARQL